MVSDDSSVARTPSLSIGGESALCAPSLQCGRAPEPLIRLMAVWIALGLLAAAALVLLLRLDYPVTDYLTAIAGRGTPFHAILHGSAYLFTWWTYVCVFSFVILVVPNRRLTCVFAIAAIGSALSVHLLKLVVGRARPDLGLGAFTFDMFSFADGYDSMPSATTASAVILAIFVARLFPRTAWVCFTAATLTAISRIVKERHFLSDVMIGGAIALLWAWWAPRLERRFNPAERTPVPDQTVIPSCR